LSSDLFRIFSHVQHHLRRIGQANIRCEHRRYQKIVHCEGGEAMYLYDSPASFSRSQNLGQSPVSPRKKSSIWEPSLPQYTEPFPNIKRDCPWEHRKAMDAYLALQEVKYFQPYYK